MTGGAPLRIEKKKQKKKHRPPGRLCLLLLLFNPQFAIRNPQWFSP